MIKASDCKCCMCGKPAVAFWPCIDPDIPQHPYCRECLDKQQMQAFLSIFGDEEGSQSYQRAKKEKAKKSKTQ